MDEALHFIRPAWLLAVIPAVLLAVLWARRRRSGSHWESSIEPELLAALLEPARGGRSRLLPWLVGGWLTAGAVGLAGPAWERLPQPVEQKNDALVIVLDLSLSMFAEDIAPSRLVRARQKITDVLRLRDEGFTALVAYAGDAHAVVPLTDDVRTIENLLGALRPDMMPVLGSDLGGALEQAHQLFRNANLGRGRILVVTDAVERLNDVRRYGDARFPISVLGVGTPSGSTIPLDFVNQPGQVLRSQQGNAITVSLDASRLAEAAEIGHGRYHSITLDDRDISHLLATSVPGEDELTRVDREFDTWADLGFWVTLPLLAMLLWTFRRGVLALLPLCLPTLLLGSLMAPATARAGLWDDLWQRSDQQAHELLRRGEPERAAALFEQPDWRAAALYRSGEYAAAAEHFRARGDATGLYNLGNALARQHHYDDAIAAYDQALELAPDHADAQHNRALVEKLQEQQSGDQDDASRPQPGDGQPGQNGPPDDDSESSPGDDAAQDGLPPASAPPEDGDPSDDEPGPGDAEHGRQESLASRSEQQEALEQWLRRVPDEPGGLLRRKFQYETNQRLRQGDYRSRDSEQIW